MEKLTIEYEDHYVPIELCTIDRDGGADDCEACSDTCRRTMAAEECEICPIQICFDKLGHYERLHELIEKKIKDEKLTELQWLLDLYENVGSSKGE